MPLATSRNTTETVYVCESLNASDSKVCVPLLLLHTPTGYRLQQGVQQPLCGMRLVQHGRLPLHTTTESGEKESGVQFNFLDVKFVTHRCWKKLLM